MLNSDDAQLFPERTAERASCSHASRACSSTGSAEMYTLEGEAYELFRTCHDELKQKTKDENVQGILSKARGYLARIAMTVWSRLLA